MAAGKMETDGTLRFVETVGKSTAMNSQSVSLLKLWNVGVKPSDLLGKFASYALAIQQVGYAISSGCNKPELSAELANRQSLFVLSLIQQLRSFTEVHLPSSASPCQCPPAPFLRKGRAIAAASQMTEFRRGRRHPAGRQGRSHESRAARRAGSQG